MDEVVSLAVADVVVSVVGVLAAAGAGLEVKMLESHTKPMTTSTTARTAITGCLSRTSHAFLVAPRRRAESPTVDQSREGLRSL